MADASPDAVVSISTPIANASTAMSKLSGGSEEDFFKGGYKECIQKMDSGAIKVGRILALVRSFEHHKYREESEEEQSNIVTRLAQIMIRPIIEKEARRRLKKFGQEKRHFAYVHTAIYVGKGPDGKHYVVENAGGKGSEEGDWLRLTDVQKAFNDLLFDDSKFMVIKPDKAHTTAQKALAAYYHKFPFRYNGFGFNCETFTSVCADLRFSLTHPDEDQEQPQQQEQEQEQEQEHENQQPKTKKQKQLDTDDEDSTDVAFEALKYSFFGGTEHNPCQRAVVDKGLDLSRVRRGAWEHARNQRQFYVKELQLLLLQKVSEVDSADYKLGIDQGGVVCVEKKSNSKTPSQTSLH